MEPGFTSREYHIKKGNVYHHLICWDDRFQYRTHNSSMQTLYEVLVNYENLSAGFAVSKKKYKFIIPFSVALILVTFSAIFYYLFSETYHPDVFKDEGEGVILSFCMLATWIISIVVILVTSDSRLILRTSKGEIKIPMGKDEELLNTVEDLFKKRDTYLKEILRNNPNQLSDMQRKQFALHIQHKRVITLDQLGETITRNTYHHE